MSIQDPEQAGRDRVQESILEILRQAANPVGRPEQRVGNRIVSFLAGSMFDQLAGGQSGKSAQNQQATTAWQPSDRMNTWFDRAANWFGDKSVEPGTPTGRERFSYDVMRDDGTEERLSTAAGSKSELDDFLQAIHDRGQGVVTNVRHEGQELSGERTSPLERMMNAFSDWMGVPEAQAITPPTEGENHVTDATNLNTDATDRNTDALNNSGSAPPSTPGPPPPPSGSGVPPVQPTGSVPPVQPQPDGSGVPPFTPPGSNVPPVQLPPSSGSGVNDNDLVDDLVERSLEEARKRLVETGSYSGVNDNDLVDDLVERTLEEARKRFEDLSSGSRIPPIPPTWDEWFGDDEVQPPPGSSTPVPPVQTPPVTPPGSSSPPPTTPPGGSNVPPIQPPSGSSPVPPVTPPGGSGPPPKSPPGGSTPPAGGGGKTPSAAVSYLSSRLGVAASTVQRFSAAIGLAAPPLFAAYLTITAIIAVGKALKKLADEAWITTQKLANYNGMLAYGAAMLDWNREMRKFQLAGAIAKGGGFDGADRFNIQNRLEEAQQPMDELSAVMGNNIGTIITGFQFAATVAMNQAMAAFLAFSSVAIDLLGDIASPDDDDQNLGVADLVAEDMMGQARDWHLAGIVPRGDGMWDAFHAQNAIDQQDFALRMQEIRKQGLPIP